MLNKREVLNRLATAALLTGCAAPYQEDSILRELTLFNLGGYSSKQISEDQFQVEFSASQHTDYETVAKYVQYRSATLSLEKGYDGFIYEAPVHYLSPPRNGYKKHVGTTIRLLKRPFAHPGVIDAKALQENLKLFIESKK
jgi:hypothetical protein